jgi:tRNA (cytidine/uridine-2'-O-)-methyltransferase
MLHVVLHRPQIPPNTGNIARQCVGMRAALHVVGPIEFDLSEHAVKRAGLDYWPHLDLTMHEGAATFFDWLGDRKPWLITKRGRLRYDHPAYADGDVLIFGNETQGLPPDWHERWPDRTVFIPIPGRVRSYNLSNAVAVVLAQASLSGGLFGE